MKSRPLIPNTKTLIRLLVAILLFVPATINAATIRSAPINGLVGHWTFDKSTISGTSVRDVSGRGNTGTMVGGVTGMVGKLGQGLSFDGSTGRVSVPQKSQYNFGTGNFTVGGWVYITTIDTYGEGIMGKLDPTNSTGWAFTVRGATYGASAGKLNFAGAGHAGLWVGDSNSVIPTNQWAHVLAVRNAGVLMYYVNGVADGTAAYVESSDNSLDASLGYLYSADGGDWYLDGLIDDIRIYNRALSASEVSSLYRARGVVKIGSTIDSSARLKNGLVGHWTFDGKNMGTTSAYDLSGNNNTGWLLGGVKKAIGKVGQGLQFDGSTGYVSIPNVTADNASSYLTVSAWIKPKSITATNYPMIVSKYTNSTNRWEFAQGGPGFGGADALVAIMANGSQTYGYTGAGVLVADQWQHVVMVFDGTQSTDASRLKVYVNGINKSLTFNPSIPATTPTQTSAIQIGESSSFGYKANGLIDDVRVYNRALSADEVRELYTAGGGVTGASSGVVQRSPDLASGLVGYWSFDGKNMGTTSAYDLSGNGNTGWLNGGVKKVIGKVGQGVSFNGSSGYVNASDPASGILDFGTNSFSVSAWVNYKTVPALQYQIVTKQLTTGPTFAGWDFSVINTAGTVNAKFQVYNSSGIIALGVTPLSTNRWYHLVGVRDSSANKVRIYVNGVLDKETAGGNNLNMDCTMPLFIGKRNDGYFTNGLIDDVRVYNRALSQAEITRLYRLGR